MFQRATENAVASHMWFAGLQLDHTDLSSQPLFSQSYFVTKNCSFQFIVSMLFSPGMLV